MGQISEDEKKIILMIVVRISDASRDTGYFAPGGDALAKALAFKAQSWMELSDFLDELTSPIA